MQAQNLKTLEIANADFYKAFEALDIQRMRLVWSHDDSAKCIHPGWQPLYGYDDIMQSWNQIFKSADYMEIELLHTQFQAAGGVGVVWGVESILVASEGKTNRNQVHFTNVYVKESHQWRMMLHHASP